MIPVEESFSEEWVRETLLLVLPEGVVGHRAPEVVRAVQGATPTFQGIRTAFWEPLQLFVRPYSREADAIKDRLIERLEDTFAKDDRPYVSEWLKAQGNLRWTWKDRDYWKGVFKRADEESRLPDHKSDYSVPKSHRTQDAMWWRALRPYTDEWRLPDRLGLAFDDFKKPSDWVRLIRYIERNTRGPGSFPRLIKDDLDVRYGLKTARVLQERIRLMTEGKDCVDNVRVAACDNKREMSHYRWQKRNGCCGFADIQIDVLGRSYMIGCNYGH